MNHLRMDDIGTYSEGGYIYVVVQASVPHILNTTESYNEAKKLSMLTANNSVILAISPETIEAINRGTTKEIIV